MPTNDALDLEQAPAGQTLDAAVQRAVWGSNLLRIPTAGEPHHWVIYIEAGKVQPIPPYSSSIEAAWLIIARLKSLGFGVRIDCDPFEVDEVWVISTRSCWRTKGNDHPLAICRAALSAVAMASEGDQRGE
jgi:hypothetical protein